MRKTSTLSVYLVVFMLLMSIKPLLTTAQGKQANYWYFGGFIGLNFNIGSPPEVLYDGQMWTPLGSATISDENGNLLFYGDGSNIWNRNHIIMQGSNLIGDLTEQGAVIVPNPGNSNLFYYFNFDLTGPTELNFQYSIIDMSFDNGLGAVVQSKIPILSHTYPHLTAVMHSNQKDVWVIVHKEGSSAFYSYLVTANGIDTVNPSVSNVGTIYANDDLNGYLKISPNGKKIASTVRNNAGSFCEIFDFNTSTGFINDQNILHIVNYGVGVEFSPDNNLLYLRPDSSSEFLQFDLNAGTPQQIIQSAIQITNEFPISPGALQLGPDGKIYCATDLKHVGVINSPNTRGTGCNYVKKAIYVGDGVNRQIGRALPSFIQTYLNDPEFSTTKHCHGNATEFTILNTSGIDSVFWKFKDFYNIPNDTSTSFNPTYTYTNPGTYYPELTVWSGLLPPKTVKDTVVILPNPVVNLGKDTTFCADVPVFLPLDAGSGFSQYKWNGSWQPGPQTYDVTAPGEYTVIVRDANFCYGYDTIQVSVAPEILIVAEPDLKDSHCGISDGSITGMVLSGEEPLTLEWKNSAGDIVGTTADLPNIPADTYTLTVTDNGCSKEFPPYTINDIGATAIGSAVPEPDHCDKSEGRIIITPESGNATDFEYSLNGSAYISNGGVFESLSANFYTVSMKDVNNCESSWPLQVEVINIPGPDLSCIPEDATGGAANGKITVNSTATNLTYQLNNLPPQTSNVFEGLLPDTYKVTVTDEFGCSNFQMVVVGNQQGTLLTALADGDRKCLNKPASSKLRVSGVAGVKDFTASLAFDNQKLKCTNFNADLQGIIPQIYPATSRVVLEWHGMQPLTSNDTISLGELIFETIQAGSADINWDSPPVTHFTDEYGNVIEPHFIRGTIEIHEIPTVQLTGKSDYCEGESINLGSIITGGTEPIKLLWSTPNGVDNGSGININNASALHSGLYTFTTSDYFHCADTARISIAVYPVPSANFPMDTIPFEQTTTLEATQGYSSYLWNTGDTTYYVNVDKQGEYSVIIQTKEGCSATEKVFMLDTFVPILVPNAFTPNGDGLNDTFKPVINFEQVRHYSMSIYNKWGQLVFETNNPKNNWTGQNAMQGIYTWVISYSNMVGKVYQMKGSVALVR